MTRPLNYLVYRTTADDKIVYLTMLFMAIFGAFGVFGTLKNLDCEVESRGRYEVRRERDEERDKSNTYVDKDGNIINKKLAKAE